MRTHCADWTTSAVAIFRAYGATSSTGPEIERAYPLSPLSPHPGAHPRVQIFNPLAQSPVRRPVDCTYIPHLSFAHLPHLFGPGTLRRMSCAGCASLSAARHLGTVSWASAFSLGSSSRSPCLRALLAPPHCPKPSSSSSTPALLPRMGQIGRLDAHALIVRAAQDTSCRSRLPWHGIGGVGKLNLISTMGGLGQRRWVPGESCSSSLSLSSGVSIYDPTQ